MLFESSYWAGTVIKLLITTLFFISELIFREITWWWTKPERWPGRQNFRFWNNSSIVQWFWIFRGNSLYLLSSVAQSPEYSLQAGGGWRRLVTGHLTMSATFVGTLQEVLGGAITLQRTHSSQINWNRPPGLLAGAFLHMTPIAPLPPASWGQASQQHSTQEDVTQREFSFSKVP